MTLLAPLALLFGLSLPALAALYLLKVKRRPRRVASTMHWRRAVEDARASVPFQKLRRNLLMFLQLLALALLTWALARPVLNLASREPSTVAILIDVSASMAVRSPDGARRIDAARERAAEFASSLPGGSRAALIEYAESPSVAEPLTGELARVPRAARRAEPRAAPDEAGDAISLAASLVENSPRPRVVVFSDSFAPDEATLDRLAGIPVSVEICGGEAVNAGWTAFDLRRKADDSGRFELFGRIACVGGEDRGATIEIRADDALVDARRIDLSPVAGETRVLVEDLDLPAGEPVVRARIVPDAGDFDGLAWDDEVVAPLGPPRRLSVLLCTPGNRFLERAIAALGDADVSTIRPGDAAPAGDWRVAVFDRGEPSNRIDAPTLFIGMSPWGDAIAAPAPGGTEPPVAPVPVAPVPVAPLVADPGPIAYWDVDHPVSRPVEWSTVTVYEARRPAVPQGGRVLVEAEDFPLLVAGRVGGRPALALAFDVLQSNFPLRSGFPIFVAAGLRRLAEGDGIRETGVYAGGESFEVEAPASARTVEAIDPAGNRRPLRDAGEGRRFVAETHPPGLWRVEADGETAMRFGVALLSQRESAATLAEPSGDSGGELAAADRTESPASESDAASGAPGADERRSDREIWRWIALGALGLLLVEWGFYKRGAGR